MSKLVRNERTKMIATHLNNMAVASVVTGIIVPNIQGVSILDGWKWLWPFALGLVGQFLCLVSARWVLGSLEE
jgi:hypothetical protein